MSATVNYARNKRQAHTIGRGAGDQSWNPFQHFTWNHQKSGNRADTWAGSSGRLEEGNGGHLTHALSEPPRSYMPRDGSNVETTLGSSGSASKDGEDVKKSMGMESPNDSHMLRNRGRDGDALRIDTNLENNNTTAPTKEMQDLEDDSTGKVKKQKKDRAFFKRIEPKEPFTVGNQLKRTILNSWINLLLIMAPVGIAVNYVDSINRIAVFVINFIAIIPLAAMLSFATEEIALRTGEVLGGLLNASFGNAVELIIAIIALTQDEIEIVQTSLIGSILSNLLLVMGCCFFFGGLRRIEQNFNQVVAQTAASMLALAVASVIIPTVFDSQLNDQSDNQSRIAHLSRGTAVILLLVYAAYLFFQLKTHQSVFTEESKKVPAKPWGHGPAAGAVKQGMAMPGAVMGHGMQVTEENDRLTKMLRSPLQQDGDEEGEEPQLHFWVAIGTLALSTVFIALCAEFMVDSIDAITQDGAGISKEFVGLILLPIVGNAAEHATAVTVAIKDKMDLAIGVAVGSSMQVALFLIPLLVIIGWGMGNDRMDLSFDVFQVTVMFVAVLLVNYLIGDGKSHWLEGFLLICLYAIIAVCAFFYPL